MKRIFVTIILAGVAFLNAQSGDIPLRGELPGSGNMKTPQDIPVAAYQYANSVEITFSENLGDLEITVVDASGITVFQTTVNAASGSSVIISTTGWSKGAYTLIIADDAGGCLKGSFNIKK